MIYNMDCIEGMKMLDDKSIDMILVDPPYGTTACRWDNVIPFEPMWEQINRIIKDDSAVVFTANNPFSSFLVCSNPDMYRYEWIWDKVRGYNFQQANYAPMKNHEHVLVFSKLPAIYNKKGTCRYYPIKTDGDSYISIMGNQGNILRKNSPLKRIKTAKSGRYPKSIQTFAKDKPSIHPTQKPVELFKYLIRTYTNENDLVLDFCIGSGTTAIACLETNRRYVGFELDTEYYNIANDRIERWHNDI